MNPFLKEAAKAWLLDVLKKAAASGGVTAFDEILASLPEKDFRALQEAVSRVAGRRKITVDVKNVSSP